ncbi:phosphatase PAP2 family protein [Rickettsia endosymbiont of Cardiosporidium cionae]|uniref:phosphatase PAP2 family protein n=1 Tax=Rickettsia endosymbiont of Cardiosporidium cionae TaxID=2777155 RepID=UPI001894612A|nr:phosphatase PAP2 family protein [Rickettsia endosymbiont of Cardiosporidium cionae]
MTYKAIFYDMLGINKWLFIWINQLTNISFIDKFLYIVAHSFDTKSLAVIYLIYCVYLCIAINYKVKTFNFKNTKIKYLKIEEYFLPRYLVVIKITLCYGIFIILFTILKISSNMPRPFCSLNNFEFITIEQLKMSSCFHSFPSAHTGSVILISYYLWQYSNKTVKYLFITIILIVSISRISLAMHYPSDIIYSVLITYIIILINNYSVNQSNYFITLIGKKIFKMLFSIFNKTNSKIKV